MGVTTLQNFRNLSRIRNQLVCKALQSRSFVMSPTWSHNHGTERPAGGISYMSVPGQQPLLGLTLGQLVDQSAAKYGDALGLVVRHQGIRRTYKQLQAEVNHLASGFVEIGFSKGDRIGVWGHNSHEWYLTHMAAAKAGLILVNINPSYEAPEVLYALNKVGMRGIVIAEEFRGRSYYDILSSVLPSIKESDPGKLKDPNAPSLKIVVSMSKKSFRGTFSFDEVLSGGSRCDTNILRKIADSVQFDDVFNIQFTSGTTGKPKGVMLSHHNIVNNSHLIATGMEYSPADKLCVAVPFFHCYGGVGGVMAGLHAGATVVFPSNGFDPKEALRAVEEEKCTALYGTPTMHVDMTSGLARQDVSSLRVVLTAGSICTEDLAKEMTKSYGCPVASFYGLTETSPVFFQSLPQDSDTLRISTVGYPKEHTEVKLIDTEGAIVPLGMPGEMCARGYMTMLGYWNDPEKTREVLDSAGWFRTGDTFVMNETGHARIVGRLKDMIIRGGENIYPREVEECLHLHPKILEAHVFGVPHKRLGEVVAAWIRLKDGETMTEEEFRADHKGKIASFKLPKYVFFRSDFPKTASGKIQKFIMREKTMEILEIKD